MPVFRMKAVEGRRYLERRQFEKASTALVEALEMWRGPAGEDTPRDGTLAPIFQALNDGRCDVFEDYAEARIRRNLHRHLKLEPQRALTVLRQDLARSGAAR